MSLGAHESLWAYMVQAYGAAAAHLHVLAPLFAGHVPLFFNAPEFAEHLQHASGR